MIVLLLVFQRANKFVYFFKSVYVLFSNKKNSVGKQYQFRSAFFFLLFSLRSTMEIFILDCVPMTEKKVEEIPVDSDDDDDDDDYAPTKNENEPQSGESEDSEVEEGVIVNEEKPTIESNIKPYDESKVDELWKNFTNSPSNSKPSTTDVNTEKKTFDYAGEKVSVSVPSTSSLKRPATTSNSILDRLGLGKKPKLSTLEKSRLDWSAHKDTESLNDDLDSHRRGKNSYVEKQAFLERTEHRQHDHYLTHVKKK